jgi:hypothetical protein
MRPGRNAASYESSRGNRDRRGCLRQIVERRLLGVSRNLLDWNRQSRSSKPAWKPGRHPHVEVLRLTSSRHRPARRHSRGGSRVPHSLPGLSTRSAKNSLRSGVPAGQSETSLAITSNGLLNGAPIFRELFSCLRRHVCHRCLMGMMSFHCCVGRLRRPGRVVFRVRSTMGCCDAHCDETQLAVTTDNRGKRVSLCISAVPAGRSTLTEGNKTSR